MGKKFKNGWIIVALTIIFSSILSGCSNEYLISKIAKNLNDYFIIADYNVEDNTMSVEQTLNYKNNTGASLSEIKFQVYANAFSSGATNKPVSTLYEEQAYPNGLSYGGIEINNITVEGEVVEYVLEDIDKTTLVIPLDETFLASKSVEINMQYELTLPNINHRFGYGNNAINLGNFYPIACMYENGEFVTNPYSPNGDPFYSELSNYLVKITYPNGYTLANTGYETNKVALGDKKTTSTLKAQAVRDFTMVLSDKFEVKSANVGDTLVNYYYYDDDQADKSLETATQALETFTDIIGDYPYSTLSVVETNFVHGGMEYPNLVYVSDNLSNYEDYTNVIVHEIAHQWWYGMVGSNAFKNGWLDEGLTEYTTALFYEANPEYEVELEDIMGNALTAYTMFVDVYESVFGTVDTSLTRTLNDYNTEPEYVYMAYVKSMLLFDSIRDLIGDKKFFKALSYYFEENKMTNVTQLELINAFEKSSNRSLEGVFNSWIDGTVLIKDIN